MTIIVAGADPARLHAALSLAAAQAALGRPARIFLQGEAAALIKEPIEAPDDPRYGAAGLPRLGELLDEAKALGVQIMACQSGLALSGLRAEELAPGIEVTGLIDLLSRGGDDQLLLA